MANDTRLEVRRGGLRVLVLDDNHDAADSLATLLTLWGHQPLVAYDSLSAVELARTQHPDVALLDLGLPRINGFEAAERLRKQPESKDVVLIAVTGHGSAETRRRAKVYGFSHHLLKPVDLDELRGLLLDLAAQLLGLPRPPAVAKKTQRMRTIRRPKRGSEDDAG